MWYVVHADEASRVARVLGTFVDGSSDYFAQLAEQVIDAPYWRLRNRAEAVAMRRRILAVHPTVWVVVYELPDDLAMEDPHIWDPSDDGETYVVWRKAVAKGVR